MSNIVTFDQVKKLKEMGFSLLHESFEDVDDFGRWYTDSRCISTVSEALGWLRDKYGVYCGIIPYMWNYRGKAIFQGKLNLSCPNEIMTDNHESYDLAESALLDEILTCLEK